MHFPLTRTKRQVRVSASAGPPPANANISLQRQRQVANNNAQPALYGKTAGSRPLSLSAGNMGADSGCVRAPYDEWYVDRSDCLQNIPDGLQCNPRYINGVWARYHPYARDSAACGGVLPADVLPQVLDATSIIDTEIATYIDNVQLALSTNGEVGKLRFTYNNSETGNPQEQVNMTWNEENNVGNTLFNPVEYVYAVPYGTGIARLTINTLNGHATARFPFQNFLAKLQFQITNIQNWRETQRMNTATANTTDHTLTQRIQAASRMSRQTGRSLQKMARVQLG